MGLSSKPVQPFPARDPKRFVSVASRLAVVIFALVALVSALVAYELTRREEAHLIESQSTAGAMLTELLAASIAPALDFADAEAVSASLGMLAQNRDVVDAAAWPSDGDEPLGLLHPDGALRGGVDHTPGARVTRDHIDIVRAVKSPTGKALGTVLVRVSLAQENAAFAAARRRIFWIAFVLSGLVAGLLVAVIRRTIVSPLDALERAARGLSRGELTEVQGLRRDEIGSLGNTFNHMGRAIRQRESRIFAMNERLQGLLDIMRQAIVVFDGSGKLGAERSRLARQIFGDAKDSNKDIVELLYPAELAPDVERDAFRAWLTLASTTPSERFDELGELAPKEVRLRQQSGEDRLLELEFRRAASDDGEPRIMLLATDVTSQRRLERSAETREREHQKQLAAMRRLLSGGGQVFVRFLSATREKLARAQRDLAGVGPLEPEAVESAFQLVHTLRAEARSFDLGSVEELALGLEFELVGARHAPRNSELLTTARPKLRAGLATLVALLDEAEALFVQSSPIGRRVLEQVTVSRADVDQLFKLLGERRDELGRLASRLTARPFGELASTLPDDAARWATRDHKRALLAVNGRETLVPGRLAERLGGVLAHLVRNAIAHGIETPERRLELGKPAMGRVELECRELERGVQIRVTDDGAGFDTDALGGQSNGAGTNLEAAFEAGRSTRKTADELGGFGVGLGAVRAELKAIGYVVKLSSERGTGASVVIEPAATAEEGAWSIKPSSS